MSISLVVTERKGAAADAVPAVVYGPKQPNVAIAVDRAVFGKLFKEAGESTIITLEGLEAPIEVLVHEVTFHPTKNQITHIDFYAIERGKDMTVDVPLNFIGESPVEKVGGMVNKVLHEVEVTCRPSKLPSHIDVDLSALANIDDRITVADIKALEGVTINTDTEEVVAIAAEAGANGGDEEPTDVDMDAIKVEKKGKEETEE